MIVAIVGAESTGKTMLAQALAARLRAAWVPEVLREWCDREGRTPRPEEQLPIAEEQERRVDMAVPTPTVQETTKQQPAMAPIPPREHTRQPPKWPTAQPTFGRESPREVIACLIRPTTWNAPPSVG